METGRTKEDIAKQRNGKHRLERDDDNNAIAGHQHRTRMVMRLREAHKAKDALSRQVSDIDDQIAVLLDRIVEASSVSLIRAYEAKIERLERSKLELLDQATEVVPAQGRFDDFIEHTMTFLASPWNVNYKGNTALKRTVLKLCFAVPLRYCRENGYRTAETTFPFKVSAEFSTPKCGMVGDPGIEPGVRLREGTAGGPCHRMGAADRSGGSIG